MDDHTILNWDNTDPIDFYTRALNEFPVYYDQKNGSWVCYSYESCLKILMSPDARIPEIPYDDRLSPIARDLLGKLARLANEDMHSEARMAADLIYRSITHVDVGKLLDELLWREKTNQTVDFVRLVALKLPALVIMKGLGFKNEECAIIVNSIEQFVKVMVPKKTGSEVATINHLIPLFYHLAKYRISQSVSFMENANPDFFRTNENQDLIVCNLIGLLVQSYDASRGILCNGLIQLIKHHQAAQLRASDKDFFRRAVVEILRYDPPVHLTKRVAAADIFLNERVIKKGDMITVVMAAANLDHTKFEFPLVYNPDRLNNSAHLTFGAGGHACLAKELVIDMASRTFQYLFKHFKNIIIHDSKAGFEPKLNVRLMKRLIITLS